MVDALLSRAFRACEQTGVDRLVVAGGVARNSGLRQAAQARGAAQGVAVFFPDADSCTDNGAMIAHLGALRLTEGVRDDFALEAYSRSEGFRKGKIRP